MHSPAISQPSEVPIFQGNTHKRSNLCIVYKNVNILDKTNLISHM